MKNYSIKFECKHQDYKIHAWRNTVNGILETPNIPKCLVCNKKMTPIQKVLLNNILIT